MSFFWSGLRGSNSLPGIPRMVSAHSQEPCLSSVIECALRARVEAASSPSVEKEKGHPFRMSFFWSGLRGSNSLPPPWQGGALPDELSPRNRTYLNRQSRFCQHIFQNFFNFFIRLFPRRFLPPLAALPQAHSWVLRRPFRPPLLPLRFPRFLPPRSLPPAEAAAVRHPAE